MTRCATLVAATAVALTLAAPSWGGTCRGPIGSTTLTVTLSAGEAARLVVSGGVIQYTGSTTFNCRYQTFSAFVTATTTNTDTINVVGTTSNELFRIDETGGLFAPGKTAETGLSEIEFSVDLGSGTGDTLVVDGTNGPDTITFSSAGFALSPPFANLNGDDDGDVTTRNNELHAVHSYLGNDTISGGGSGVNAFSRTLLITGGDGNDRLTGGSAADTIFGDYGDGLSGIGDTIAGGAGNDTLSGDGGNDRFVSATRDGADVVSGGGDVDTIDYTGRTAALNVSLESAAATDGETGEADAVQVDVENVVGGNGNDQITGHGGPNVLNGAGGNDILSGRAGSDTLDGGQGTDSLQGGNDNDTLRSPSVDGPDTFNGEGGFDWADYSGRTSTINVTLDSFANDGAPGEGDVVALTVEKVRGGNGNDTITGSDNTLVTTANIFDGGAGNDILDGRVGNDTLIGGSGNDTFRTPSLDGADGMTGGLGTDTADYSGRAATLTITLDASSFDGEAGEGDNVGSEVENVLGGSAGDTITGGSLANRLEGRGGNDTLSGGSRNDVLVGGPNSDTLDGGAGFDTFSSPSLDGADRMIGGTEIDTVDYNGRTSTLTVSLDNAANDGQSGEGDNVGPAGDVENVTGGSGADIFTGNGLANRLSGNGGGDRLTGGTGSDSLLGGSGADTIFAREGVADTVDGGSETDSAQIDSGLDSATNVETFLA